jgi:signal transduction histidine kinase/ligand-binding sensor protein/ActR/RegA family two-component response regulator
MLDRLYEVARIPSAIIDMEGNILTGAGWQRICLEFHRKNPAAEEICIASDRKIAADIKAGKPYAIYECPHGLVDSSCPIVIEGEHVANVFTGQMLHTPLTDEIRERFRRQAREYGFDEEAYLEALAEVPVFPLEKHRAILDLLSQLAQQIAQTGLSRLRAIDQGRLVRESEKRFRLLMDSLDALVYVADMDTYEVLFINKFGRDLLGDITGRTCWKSIQEGQSGPCDFCTNKYLLDTDGKPAGVHAWEFQNTVTGRWFLIRDRAIEWMDGRVVRLEIATDFTERMTVEEEKQALEAQLRQAQKMEAVGTLAGGIAHDFNNILAIILGNASLALYDSPGDSPVRKEIEEISAAAHRAKELVEQILSFSRRDKGKKKLLPLCHLVEENMKMWRATIPSTVEIRIDIPDRCHENPAACGQVLVDPTQIHQLLLNLGTNAVQAMEEKGTLAITVREVAVGGGGEEPHPGLTPGTYERLTVSDTGGGMDEAIIENIFDPFFTTKEAGRGTGMGLSVVHGIVANHGAKIFVDSAPGKGSTFAVYFPVAATGQREEEAGAVRSMPTGSERILFVDDEKSLAAAGSKMLARLGYTVMTETGGDAALETFRAHAGEIDAVITDQTMPRVTGAELAAAMLRIRPDLPIILCTGHSNLITEKEALALGIRKVCLKPLSMEGLAVALRQALDEGGGNTPGSGLDV